MNLKMKVAILIGFQYQDIEVLEKINFKEELCTYIENNNNDITELTICKTNMEEVQNRSEKLYLPGIIVDLYQAYLFILNMYPDYIIVITDIMNDQKTSILMKAIVDSIVDADILTFIENIKKKDQYYLYQNVQMLINKIMTISYKADKLFIYYTGHAQNGDIILPNNEKLLMKDFREVLSNSVLIKAVLTQPRPFGPSRNDNSMVVRDPVAVQAMYAFFLRPLR